MSLMLSWCRLRAPNILALTRLLLCMWLLLLPPEVTSGDGDHESGSPDDKLGGRRKKVLLFPVGHGYSSHIMDFQRIGKILIAQGYDVSVLINNEDSQFMEIKHMRVHSYPCCDSSHPNSARLRLTDSHFRELMLTQTNTSMVKFIQMLSEQQIYMCEQLLKAKDVLQEVNMEQYDLLMVDFADSCSRVVVQYFGDIPAIVYSSIGFTFDMAFFPNLVTIIPTFTTNFIDDMSFWERTENVVRLLLIRLLCDPYYFSAFDSLKVRYGMNESLPTVRKAFAGKLTLAHASWALDFPRPLLPTVVSVGGMHIDEPKPLTPDVAAFIKRAGQKGLVIVSFGSLIDKVKVEMAAVIAEALAQLEQGVIWRFAGTPPSTLGANTLLLDWIPQNDLLAHPLTRVFVTHCGIHGTYETLKHSVPVVAVPIFADQFENANKLIQRAKMGLRLDYHSLKTAPLLDAIREVMTNSTYKANAITMSNLLFDQPMSAHQTFLFYVDFVIRHRGPGPLMSIPVLKLDTFELYGVDVVLFLLCSVSITIVFAVLMLTGLVRLSCRLCNFYRKEKAD